MSEAFLASLGLGTAPLGGLYSATSYEDAITTLDAAWDAGIRYFDTAPHYGQGRAERFVGDYLRCKPKDEYELSTKVGRLLRPAKRIPDVVNSFVAPLPFEQILTTPTMASCDPLRTAINASG